MTVAVEIDLADPRKIMIDSEPRYKDLCKSLPGSSWNKKAKDGEGAWFVPLSWTTCLALRSTFRTDLQIGPRLAEWATNERGGRIATTMHLRALEAPTDDYVGNEDLYPHQRAGVQFLTAARQALLADQPGLGKTAQAIRAIADLYKNGEDVFPVLVVCPNTLKKNWVREFAMWWPGIEAVAVKGTTLKRRKQLATPAHVYVLNWESLRSHSRLVGYGDIALKRCLACGGEDEKVTANRCEVHERELNLMDFKTVIADEVHRAKSPKSAQNRALIAATGDAEFRFALTGTPIANDAVDLWPILHWLSPGEWPTKTKWVSRMLDSMFNAFGGLVVTGVKPEMLDEFYSTINPRMRRMLKEIVLPNLPPIIRQRRDCEMSPKQLKAYEQMRDSMIAELDSGSGILEVTSPLTRATRLSQFASSYAELVPAPPRPEDEPGRIRERVVLSEPSNKVDALMDDIENGDFGDQSVAVCAVSRQLLMLLSAAMDKAKIPHGLIVGGQDDDVRQKSIDDFQAGRTKWVLYTAQAGGVGVTLTAASTLVMLQRPWSLVDYLQALDRVHRIGSEIHEKIVIIDYVTDGALSEEKVFEALVVKGENFEQVVNDRELLRALLKDDWKASKGK